MNPTGPQPRPRVCWSRPASRETVDARAESPCGHGQETQALFGYFSGDGQERGRDALVERMLEGDPPGPHTRDE